MQSHLPAVAEDLEPQRQSTGARAIPYSNQELLAMYRQHKAENRPRDRSRRYHIRDEELGDCLLEVELGQLEHI